MVIIYNNLSYDIILELFRRLYCYGGVQTYNSQDLDLQILNENLCLSA